MGRIQDEVNDRYAREELLATVKSLEDRLAVVERMLAESRATTPAETTVKSTDYTNMLGIATVAQINGSY